jgi:hypothetical protein
MNNNADTNSSPQFGNPEEEGLPRIIRVDDSDFDNYWNKEGAFEYETDKYDETQEEIEGLEEAHDPIWQSQQEEAYEQQQDESYQQWAMEEQERNDSMEEAIEQFYRNQEDQG